MWLRSIFALFLDHLPEEQREARWRTKLLVEVGLNGAAACWLMGAVFAGLRAWPHAVVCGVLGLLLLALLALLHATRRLLLVTNLALGTFTAVLLLPVTEPTHDGAAFAFLALVPYIAVVLLPRRAAFFWSAGVLALVALAFLVQPAHLLPVLAGFGGPYVTLVRELGFIATVFVFGSRFARERSDTVHELERVNRAKSVFLANMSHEIRTPMNGVLGLTEVLLQGPLSAQQRENLLLILRSGQAMVSLTNDLLDMSKIEAGSMTLEKTDFELSALLTDLRVICEAQARPRGLTVEVAAAPPACGCLRGDALRLRQVLSNLLNNALKFTLRGGVRMTVRAVTRSPIVLEFEVHDTGIGIAASVLPRLFTPFQQGDDSTTRRFGGTGLGLALSRELVEQMGGEITARSTEGVGSVFTFRLPFEAGAFALAAEVLPVKRPAASRHTVLVVDDNPINLKVAVGLVERAGYRTRTAVNGAEAVALVQQERFLMVLMDCHMPVMDGFEATVKIRGLEGELALIPIIALTASVMPEEIERCKLSGMNDCLTKPVSLQVLASTLAKVEAWAALLREHAPDEAAEHPPDQAASA
jgi:signal transduction histidine kinase/ActR/RegA family two-component response regulator